MKRIWAPAKINRIIASLIVAASTTTACQTTQPQSPADKPPATQTTTAPARPAANEPALDPVIDRILTRLEQREITDLHAKCVWETVFVVTEDRERKIGEIWYRAEKPVAKFKVRFNRKIEGDEAKPLNEEHLFDGEWYIELQSITKSVTRRQIRGPGDKTDPFKLGEGAFPVPFGQKKADILKEFDVALLPTGKKDPEKTDHIKLTPREGTRTGQSYKTIEFWIAQEGDLAGLPIKVRAAKFDPTGEVNSYLTVEFSDVDLKAGVGASEFRIEPPPGYDVSEEKLLPQP